MKTRITRNAIAALPATDKSKSKTWLWDTEIKCFGCYRSADGRVSFAYQYRMPGERDIRSKLIGHLGEVTLEQARALAAKLAYQRAQGIDPVFEEKRLAAEEKARQELVLSAYVAGYLQRRAERGRPLNRGQTAVVNNNIVALLGHLRMDRITIEDCEAFAAELETRGPSTRRHGVVYLKAILNDAVNRGKIAASPAANLETPKVAKRVRRLRMKEVKRLIEAFRDLGGSRGDALEITLRTGKRKSEVTDMRWEELDLENDIWFLTPDRTKPKEAFAVVLQPQVRAIVERQQADVRLRHGPVFTLDGRKASNYGAQVKELVDAFMHRRIELAEGEFGEVDRVPHFTIHDMRKVVVSTLQEKPFLVGKDVLNAILLHVGGGDIIDTYALSSLQIEAGEALQKWNDLLDALLAEPDAFPGGRHLPPMPKAERERRVADFRRGWPERAHQRRAREDREGNAVIAGAPYGRKAREERARRKALAARRAADGGGVAVTPQ